MADPTEPTKQNYNVTKITTITKLVQVSALTASEAETQVRGADNEEEVGKVLISRNETKVSAQLPRAAAKV